MAEERDGSRVASPIVPLGTGAFSVRDLHVDLSGVLEAAGISRPAAEARDLIAVVLDKPRFWAVVNAGDVLSSIECDHLREAARRRASGMPFAYAVGRTAFRHLTVEVDPRVLIPRQETEQLVQEVLDATAARPGGVAVDVGTGSGVIALSLAAEGQFDLVIGTDVSRGALAVASANRAAVADQLRCPVEFRHGALLAPLAERRASVIVSNPPYIAYAEARELPAAVRDWEPPVALFSADGGMATTRVIIEGAAELLEPGGLLALELDCRRASLAAEIAARDQRYSEIALRLDLAGRERILLATRTRHDPA